MNRTALTILGAVALSACGGGKEKPLPAYVDAADRSASCAEAVANLAQRRAEEAEDADNLQAKQFTQGRLQKMAQDPPSPANVVCYVAHVEEDGELKLNGIYTNVGYVNKTLRLAKYDPRITYIYFRITNPPGEFSRKVVFDLSERLTDLRIEGGLITKFDAEIRGEDELDAGSRAVSTH